MGLLIFFGTAGVIYIIYDRVFSKQTLVFPEKKELNELKISENSEIINANISDDKLILIIKLNEEYQIIVYDLKKNSKISDIRIDCVNDVCF